MVWSDIIHERSLDEQTKIIKKIEMCRLKINVLSKIELIYTLYK